VNDWRIILINLLVKLGVAAAVSSALARARTFQNLLFATQRRTSQMLGLVAFICVPLGLGVWMRFTVPNFQAADISFEATVILGILLGPFAALIGGATLALPALLLHHEYLALPFNLAVAITAGLYGKFVEEEEVWSFSPFVDLSIYRWIRRNLRKPRFDRQVLLMVLIVGMEIVREWLARLYPHQLFALTATSWPMRFAIWACAPIVVGIPLKVWNAIRTERSLEEQKRLVLEARLDALQRQINPHFLFNTLNSIASLVRFRPEQARELIVKLANILRALLKDHDSYILLRDELSFTDDYLSIEVVRFGADKLKVVKEIDEQTLDMPVPSMLLQPLVENSIKHGLEPRIGGGTIILRSRIEAGNMIIEVEDDGVGIAPGRTHSSGVLRGAGIGMKNVRERLGVLYGEAALFDITSRPGRGTKVTLMMPLNNKNGEPYGMEAQETPAPARSSTRS
jgi:two-component system LytT family sensor kinase